MANEHIMPKLFIGPLNEEIYKDVINRTGLDIHHAAVEIGARALFTTEITKYDNMTGFLRRDAFIDMVNDINAASEQPNMLIMLDMVGLGRINDRGGQEAGDKAIERMAGFIKSLFSENDNVFFGRLGGDEFAVACVHLKGGSYSEILGKFLSRIEIAHLNCSALADIRFWHTEMTTGSDHTEYLPAGDPKAKGIIPFVSTSKGLVRARISSKSQ